MSGRWVRFYVINLWCHLRGHKPARLWLWKCRCRLEWEYPGWHQPKNLFDPSRKP